MHYGTEMISLPPKSMEREQLFTYIREEDLRGVQNLLKKDPALVHVKDQRGSTPLLLATYYGNESISKAILEYDDTVDAKDASGNTALIGVSFKGYLDIATLLISKGADVNAQNSNGATALIFAATFKQKRIINLLIEHGADRLLKDSRGLMAIDHARMQGLNDVVALLEE